MPTDVNNLKDGQRVRAEFTVTDTFPNDTNVVWVTASAHAFPIDRADIIPDWPPEPSADEAGWMIASRFLCGNSDLNAFSFPTFPGFEYEVRCRPITLKWVPTVGGRAWWELEVVTPVNVIAIDGECAWVRHPNGTNELAMLCDLTQPKEQPHED